MSTQTDYTPEEWKTITAAPFMAGLLVSVSDLSGPVGVVKEAIAVVKGVTDTAAGSTNELIKAASEGIKLQGGRQDLSDMPSDITDMRIALIEGCKRAAAVIEQKSPGEAGEYKHWLTTLAQKTSEASREGGFLGFAGTQVSQEENAAVNDLSAALGLSAKA